MPNFFMRDRSVVRLIPMRAAAPSAPPTRPLLSPSARTISSRCFWALAPILFLDLKLSSFSLHQLGDERSVGFAVVLMRYVQKTNCAQFLLRAAHHCLEDAIGGQKTAVVVS